jgi:hypothetical protein
MSLPSITIIDIHRHIAHPGFMTNLASFPRDMFLEEIPDQTKTQKDTKPFQPSVFNDIDAQVQEQDRVGITKGVLGHAFHLADLKHDVGKAAQEIAATINNTLAEFVSKYPNKLDFLATITFLSLAPAPSCRQNNGMRTKTHLLAFLSALWERERACFRRESPRLVAAIVACLHRANIQQFSQLRHERGPFPHTRPVFQLHQVKLLVYPLDKSHERAIDPQRCLHLQEDQPSS